MDVLADILSTTRVNSSAFRRHALVAPWDMDYPPAAAAGFIVALDGHTWLQVNGEDEPVQLGPREMALLPHGTGHSLSSSVTAPGHSGASDAQRATLLLGCYTFERDSIHPLLALLPRQIHVPAPQGDACPHLGSFLALLLEEYASDAPGSGAIVSRLTDVIFIQIIRRWFKTQPESESGWLGALRDEFVGPALAAIHQDPERDWNVDALAGEVGMSRAAFSRRFRRLIGEPPLVYLTRWRMDVAARFLRETERSLAQIANRVGYTSEFAFNRAFQRVRGEPPGRYRQRSRQRAITHH